MFSAPLYAGRSMMRVWQASMGLTPRGKRACESVGGADYFGTEEGIERTPVVFVHGSFSTPNGWSDVMDGLLKEGWNGDELWAVCFDGNQPTHPQMAARLDSYVSTVMDRTGVSEVSIVAHSLGVTGARYWMDRYDRYDDVETFVGLAGGNHGLPAAHLAEPGGDVNTFLTPGSEPLARLNDATAQHSEAVNWFTIRGVYDEYFYLQPTSPKLPEAQNELLLVDHLGVRDSRRTLELLTRWL